MNGLLKILPWPIVVRLATIGLVAIGCALILLGWRDPLGMALRGLFHPVAAGIGVGGMGLLGTLGIRVFVWLCCVLWTVVILAAVPSIFRSDAVGAIWSAVGIVLFALPTAFAIRCERGRNQNARSGGADSSAERGSCGRP